MDNASYSDPATAVFDVPFFLALSIIVCLSFLTACVAVYLLRRMTAPDASNPGFGSDFLAADSRVFVFSQTDLVFASSKGQDLLSDINTDSESWDKLRDYLTDQDPELGPRLDTLQTDGTPFFEIIRSDDGVTSEVEGRPRRGLVTVSIQDWSKEKTNRRSEIEASDLEASQSRDVALAFGQNGMPLWSRAQNGEILWCNDAFKALLNRINPEKTELPDVMPISVEASDKGEAEIASQRISISADAGTDAPSSWYKLHERRTADGAIFGYAEDASDIVKAETTLNRFVATLTESFAQLSTGLAIFDANRRLNIFNPAIAELMQIDPSWLATRPGFRDFLSRSREGQMMPEQKTAADWKKRIQELERGAELGTLSEKWVLPSGQTFKITGRPHPYGSIALIVEDITKHISLERQYRSEMEQSRATLDFLTEAVCVFDTTGALVYANSACADLWGFEIKDALAQLNVVTASAKWATACKPSPVWGDLREFVTSLDNRAAWTADIEFENGDTLGTVFAPLPDGSTLAIFSTPATPAQPVTEIDNRLALLTRAHKDDVSILELAIEHMREAVNTLKADQPATAPKPAPARTDAEDIAETVSYAERLLLLRRDEPSESAKTIDTFSEDLLALLKEKEAELSISCELVMEDGHLAADMKRLLINIMLVTRSLIAPRENVDLSVAEMGDGISVSCMFKALPELAANPEKEAGLTYRIMARYLEELKGNGKIDVLDRRDFVKISCTIPTLSVAAHLSEPDKSLIGA